LHFGGAALILNDGSNNTATGHLALYSNTHGSSNTTAGLEALYGNTTGGQNTATGLQALFSNTAGIQNTATGQGALFADTTVAVTPPPDIFGCTPTTARIMSPTAISR